MLWGVAWASPEQWHYINGNARQAMSEEKSGPVETGLTGPAATALHDKGIMIAGKMAI